MADVGLDRTEPQRLVLGAVTVGGLQRLRLDRVTESCSGAVRLDRVHLPGTEPGVVERRADQPLLGRTVGRGQTVRRPVLVDRAAADQGQHGLAVPLRVAASAQEQDSNAFAPTSAVRGGGEGLAPAVGGQPALCGELVEQPGAGQDGRATHERVRALPRAQRPHREVERNQ